MPLYEYECERCGHFEIHQRISDEPLSHHECGAPAVRVISKTAFSLKGAGWYADGYGSASAKSATESASSTDSKSSADSKSAEEKSGSKEGAAKGSSEKSSKGEKTSETSKSHDASPVSRSHKAEAA